MATASLANQRPDHGGALVELINQRGRYYFGAALGILRDPEAAEDACQQAILKAWQQQERVQAAGALHAWVLRIVVNESLQVLRRRKTEKRVLANAATTGVAAPRVEDRSALRESVLLALADLDETTRTIVSLRLIQGLSGNEVKEAMGCSASEVSRRLHEGMEQLRPLLADWLRITGNEHHELPHHPSTRP